jgi:hypothetical protein
MMTKKKNTITAFQTKDQKRRFGFGAGAAGFMM